jgi:hypothetical protein
MKNIYLLIIMGTLLSCSKESWADVFPSTAERASQITYVKDSRTNLCYAYNSVNNGHGLSSDVFANVPCTPEVEKLIK